MKTEHAVVIAGGGPTGLMLAAELALAGVDVAVIERRPNQELIEPRARGLHARTLELLDQRGVVDRFLAEGQKMQVAGFANVPLDISDFPTRHNYGLALLQKQFERILAGWVSELPVRFHRGVELTGFVQDDAGVDVQLSDGQALRAKYLVGCDGGRSRVRKTAGIEFPGWDPTLSYILGEVQLAAEPTWGLRRDESGLHAFTKLPGGVVQLLVTEPRVATGDTPTLRELSETLIATHGTDYGVHSPIWLSRFTDGARQAAAYRSKRVLIAGDAAHVHNPVGGQGLNLGVHDAVNLGWKLAQVVHGTSPDRLLDTYHSERHPIAARVLKDTLAQVNFHRVTPRLQAVNDLLTELLRMEEPRKRFGARMSGLDVRYELGEGHPLLGRRMPDLDLVTAQGPVRLYSLLHRARPVLLNLGEPANVDSSPWSERVQRVDATYSGPWELPALGAVPAAKGVLVRPDGYVAWVGDGSDRGLAEALTRWFGAPGPKA